MKEIISAVLVVVGIWGGTRVLADFYEVVRIAALERASQGLPSLAEMNRQLHHLSTLQPPSGVRQKSDSDHVTEKCGAARR